MLHKGIRNLPLTSKVIRTDNVAHLFSQAAKEKGIAISYRYISADLAVLVIAILCLCDAGEVLENPTKNEFSS